MKTSRKLNEYEYQLMLRMTETFPSRAQFLAELKEAEVIPWIPENYPDDPSIEFVSKVQVPSAVTDGVPVEGLFKDQKGKRVHVLLHVRNNLVKILEFYKDDSSSIKVLPDLTNLEVLSLFDWKGN